MRKYMAAGTVALVLLASAGSRIALAGPRQPEPPPASAADAKEEAQRVLNALVRAATHLLEKNGEMFPIAAALRADGKIDAVAVPMSDEHPQSQKVIDALNEALRSGARQRRYKASAIAVDMRVIPPGESEKTDALAVRLEHASGYSVVVVFPYRLRDHKLVFGTAYSLAGTNDVFGR